jgi:hypothetical protein
MTSRRRSAATLLLIAAVALLSGCSGAGPEPAAPTPAAADGATTPAAADGATTADDCGAATMIREHLNSADVRTVTVNGQCTNVTIDTRLADGDTAGGRLLCTAAAEVAYVGDINSVTVLSGSGAELSAGIAGLRCLP